jgi:hypothetical protein
MARVDFINQGPAFFPVSQRARDYFEQSGYVADGEGWYDDFPFTADEVSETLKGIGDEPCQKLPTSFL